MSDGTPVASQRSHVEIWMDTPLDNSPASRTINSADDLIPPEKHDSDDDYPSDTEEDDDPAYCRYLCDKRQYPRTTVIPIMITDLEFIAMIDSGATLTTISRRLANVLELQGKGTIIECYERVRIFQGYANLTRYMMLNVGTQQDRIPVKCWITKEVTFDVALGTDFVEAATLDDLQSRKCVQTFDRNETPQMTNAQIHDKRQEYDEWFRQQDFRLPCPTVTQL